MKMMLSTWSAPGGAAAGAREAALALKIGAAALEFLAEASVALVQGHQVACHRALAIHLHRDWLASD